MSITPVSAASFTNKVNNTTFTSKRKQKDNSENTTSNRSSHSMATPIATLMLVAASMGNINTVEGKQTIPKVKPNPTEAIAMPTKNDQPGNWKYMEGTSFKNQPNVKVCILDSDNNPDKFEQIALLMNLDGVDRILPIKKITEIVYYGPNNDGKLISMMNVPILELDMGSMKDKYSCYYSSKEIVNYVKEKLNSPKNNTTIETTKLSPRLGSDSSLILSNQNLQNSFIDATPVESIGKKELTILLTTSFDTYKVSLYANSEHQGKEIYDYITVSKKTGNEEGEDTYSPPLQLVSNSLLNARFNNLNYNSLYSVTALKDGAGKMYYINDYQFGYSMDQVYDQMKIKNAISRTVDKGFIYNISPEGKLKCIGSEFHTIKKVKCKDLFED